MASNRKYAALPDLVSSRLAFVLEPKLANCPYVYQDSAPDIYETPELTDDNSTVPVSPIDTPWGLKLTTD